MFDPVHIDLSVLAQRAHNLRWAFRYMGTLSWFMERDWRCFVRWENPLSLVRDPADHLLASMMQCGSIKECRTSIDSIWMAEAS